MKIQRAAFPEKVQDILARLEAAGSGYLVGGCLRDLLLGRPCKDYDFASALDYSRLKELFPDYLCLETGKAFGVLRLKQGEEEFEIAKFRQDLTSNGRQPEEVCFVDDISEDVARRDFTMNALAYNSQGLFDFFGGEEDIEKKCIRFIGEPAERIEEDALRILRAFRFMSQLGFHLEEKTEEALSEKKEKVLRLSKERITEEFNKLLVGEYPRLALEAMRRTGVLEVLFPIFAEIYDYDQNTPYHAYDLWEHSLQVLEGVERDLELRLAALFHDVGKPATKTVDWKTGNFHFRGHEAKGAELLPSLWTAVFAQPKKRFAAVKYYIEQHMLFTKHGDARHLRKHISIHGREKTRKLLELCIADNAAKGRGQSKEHLRELFQKVAKEEIVTLKTLAISGKELLELGFKGEEISKKKEELLDLVLEGYLENEEALLLEAAKKKSLSVVAAVMEEKGKYLALLRSPQHKHGNRWEFPGGKVEKGERLLDAAQREVMEELALPVFAKREIGKIVEITDEEIIWVHFILCQPLQEDFQLLEHSAYVWIPRKQLLSLHFAEADLPFLRKLVEKNEKMV